MVRRAVLLAFAVAACGKDVVSASPRGALPAAALDAGADVEVAAAPSKRPSFVCGAAPSCPADHPATDRALVDAIRAAAAEGRSERAAALAACAAERVRVVVDPGFSAVLPSPDSKHLVLPVDHDDVARVFDAATWDETLRLEAQQVLPARGGRAALNLRAGGASLWDLTAGEPLPIAIPSRARISVEGTAVFWLEATPRRALVIALAGKDPVRVPIDAGPKDELTAAELPAGQYLVSNDDGRHWIVDPATVSMVRSFYVPESTPAQVAKDALLLTVGKYISGVDFLAFTPSHPPVVVSLSGKLPPQPLTGRGCASSVVIAASDDGALAVTRAADAWCLFDVSTRRLLGTVKTKANTWVDPGVVIAGTFVGPDVFVGTLDHESVRLRVTPGRPDPLHDLASIEGRLLPTTSPTSLTPRPRDRAFVGASEGARLATDVAGDGRLLHDVRPDGSIVPAAVPLDWDLDIARLTPGQERAIGARGLAVVRSCLLRPPGACVDLPIGGSFAVSPDGTWAAGRAVVGPLRFTSPRFVGGAGALSVTSTSTGGVLTSRHAPGVQSAAFTSESDLAIFGEDGALLTCSLATRACKRVATSAKAGPVPTERGRFVIADEQSVTGSPPLTTPVRAKDVAPPPPSSRIPDELTLLHVGRSLTIDPRDGLHFKDARTGDTVWRTTLPTRAIIAASADRLASLSGRELAVYDLDGGKVFAQKIRDEAYVPTGAVAIDAAGKRVAFAQEGVLRVFDVEGGRERGKWSIATDHIHAIALSPDGTKVATTSEVARTPKGREPRHDDPADQLLLVMDPSRPDRVERIALGSLRARTAGGLAAISLTNGGHVVLVYRDGGALLVDPARQVYELAREAGDDGLWLRRDAGVASLGALSPSSRGLSCLLGPRVLPVEACLPLRCERPAP